MISLQNALQAEFKSSRQIVVRFAHAPCVKLTLETRPAALPIPSGVRVLKLRKQPGALRQAA
jgi:hypothetical protein